MKFHVNKHRFINCKGFHIILNKNGKKWNIEDLEEQNGK
jgi:hypothetical protein